MHGIFVRRDASNESRVKRERKERSDKRPSKLLVAVVITTIVGVEDSRGETPFVRVTTIPFPLRRLGQQGGLRCATTTTHRSQTLSEEACSNALNKSNFLAKTFGLPARGRGATIVPTTVFSRNGRSLRHIGTQRSLRESPPSVRTSVQTRQDRREREKEIKGEGERRRRREGRGDSFRSP